MKNHAKTIVDNLRRRAHKGEMIEFGMGGALLDWLGRGAWHVETEGYDNAWPWSSPIDYLQEIANGAELLEAPTGCECEGCNERRNDAAARLVAAIKAQPPTPRRAPGLRFVPWRNCGLCGKVSSRAGLFSDGLCPACFAGQA